MKNKNYVISGLIVTIVSGLFLLMGRGPSFIESKKIVTLQEQTETEEVNKKEIDYPRERIRMPAKSLSQISSDDLKTFHHLFPDKVDVKAEVASNPHRTPESIIKFASALGPLMDKAYKNINDANLLIEELHDCALDETVAQTARALCLSNAEKLSQSYPQMKDKASDIRANVSPEVIKVLKQKNLLIKKE